MYAASVLDPGAHASMHDCSHACRPHEAFVHQADYTTAGLIHTIVFNRSLGYVTPLDVDSELYDITYVSRTGHGLFCTPSLVSLGNSPESCCLHALARCAPTPKPFRCNAKTLSWRRR